MSLAINSSIDLDSNIFHQSSVLVKACLSPADSANPLDAVKRQFNSMLFKYSEIMDGIPLAYTDLKLPVGKEYCRINGEHPWLHLDVLTNVLLFRPSIGSQLNGKITVVSHLFKSLLTIASL